MTNALAKYIDQVGMIAGIFRPFSMDEINRASRCLKKGIAPAEAAPLFA